MRQQECASEGIIEERECRLGQGHTVIDMHQPLITTTAEVEARIKKALDKGAIDEHIDELQCGTMRL